MKGIQLFKQDFYRGVSHFKDKNYNPNCNGITRFSVQFFNWLVKKDFLDTDTVYRAELKFSNKNWYQLILYTTDGYEFSFHGVSFGYHGEGSRGAESILKACGFRNTERIFELKKHGTGINRDTLNLYKKKERKVS